MATQSFSLDDLDENRKIPQNNDSLLSPSRNRHENLLRYSSPFPLLLRSRIRPEPKNAAGAVHRCPLQRQLLVAAAPNESGNLHSAQL